MFVQAKLCVLSAAILFIFYIIKLKAIYFSRLYTVFNVGSLTTTS